MRKTMSVMFIGLLGLFASVAQATEVAVVDWRQALMETRAAQQSMSQLESQIGSQQQQAQSLGQELERLQERLQQDGAVMSDSERQSLMQEGQQKERQFVELRQQIMQAQQQAEQAFLQDAEPKLERAVDEVMARHGIDVLMDINGIINTNQDLMNLTDEVTEILDSMN
ncbi:periplasmic chaperone for outer membrane proteins Skp [Franzmannia pantelleriensis]|uniref:Periplasmic chaperone for outer membrane proteins Skp n=1 Tax=Franzmannia pantelleriensis TaxID=48727 RepID=A0A1G9QFF3_9GAMM|nr:OmpH family outer membrane protein [Halomonas pantelleriensis]SDM09824.1 periplasmic chaperone for outer membrane proteins Skp [Halomonas pantelleriensis]